uniref:Uncharacterized protein n=1 Tax=viral metagenome TaxID=1070528 RepID=A0A6C0EBY2_9ZZZZ
MLTNLPNQILELLGGNFSIPKLFYIASLSLDDNLSKIFIMRHKLFCAARKIQKAYKKYIYIKNNPLRNQGINVHVFAQSFNFLMLYDGMGSLRFSN